MGTDMAETKTIDGVTVKTIHSGQKKAYGDTFYEYDVTSDLPAEEVERVCREKVYPAISKSEWLMEYRKLGCSMENAFRPHYTFEARGGGKYFYQVCQLYTD